MGVIELWWLSLAVFAVVIVVVAVLLGLIVAAAKSIDAHAAAIWIEGKQIAGNTVTIWTLETINESLASTQKSALAMKQTLASMDEKLRAFGRRG